MKKNRNTEKFDKNNIDSFSPKNRETELGYGSKYGSGYTKEVEVPKQRTYRSEYGSGHGSAYGSDNYNYSPNRNRNIREFPLKADEHEFTQTRVSEYSSKYTSEYSSGYSPKYASGYASGKIGGYESYNNKNNNYSSSRVPGNHGINPGVKSKYKTANKSRHTTQKSGRKKTSKIGKETVLFNKNPFKNKEGYDDFSSDPYKDKKEKSMKNRFLRNLFSSDKMHGDEGFFKNFFRGGFPDFGLLAIFFVMVSIGLVILFSVSITEGFAEANNPMFFFKNQLKYAILGLFASLFIAFVVNVKLFKKRWVIIGAYIFSILLLFSTYLPSNPIIRPVNLNGATRWIEIGGFRFQPSEMVKILLIICYAGYVSLIREKRKMNQLRKQTVLGQLFFDGFIDIVLPALLIGFPLVLIAFQPHVSCVIIMLAIFPFLFISSHIKVTSWVTGLITLILIFAILLGAFFVVQPVLPEKLTSRVSFDHVKNRLDIFKNPDSLDSDDTYQVDHSIKAIGSGGLWGVGFGQSKLKWGYLPMHYNDYIFSIIAEEFGFVGSVLLILLFVIYLLMGLKTARRASDVHSMLLAHGFAIYIPVHAFLNIAVASASIPPTGISLPFFSYGGTATIIFMMTTGFILAVSGLKTYIPERKI